MGRSIGEIPNETIGYNLIYSIFTKNFGFAFIEIVFASYVWLMQLYKGSFGVGQQEYKGWG